MDSSVTVIVPVYNVELYLEECLRSLISQKIPFEEIILINDGSTDRSKEICDRYCQIFPNIRLISQENRGLGSARNVGIADANGDYIIFVDSDDYVDVDVCKKIKEYLHSYAVDVLYYNASMQYDVAASEKAMTHSTEFDYCKMTGKDYLYQSFPESYSSSACLAAYRTSFLKDSYILFQEKTYFEDNLFSLKVTLEAQSIYCIPDRLYIRRCRADSIMMGDLNEKKCTDMVSVQHSMWKYLREKRIDIENTDFVKRFIFAGVLYALGYLSQATDEIHGMVQMKKLVYLFFEMWMPLFHMEKASFNQSVALLTALREVEKWDEKEQTNFMHRFWDSKVQYLAMRKEFEKRLRIEATGKMKELPFNKISCRVGIYGIGRHTQAVLNLYRLLIGEIQCDLYFIVTVKTSDEFCNRPILAVSDCKGVADEIIISSRIYQQEMKENLIEEGIDENKMITLYQQGDIYDFITINELLMEDDGNREASEILNAELIDGEK